jgi:hypothetical protein
MDGEKRGTKMGTRRMLSGTVVALASLSMAILAGSPAHAAAQVTRGELHAFAAAITDPSLAAEYGDISGHAQMVRTADGKTIVSVHVTGLRSGVAYGSHVHKAACNDGAADGHYKFDPNGPANAQNEIWPSFTTNEDGVGNGRAVANRTAEPAAMSVVVHAPGGAKIGCADLA